MIPNVVCSNKPESDVDFIKALEEYIQYFNHKELEKKESGLMPNSFKIWLIIYCPTFGIQFVLGYMIQILLISEYFFFCQFLNRAVFLQSFQVKVFSSPNTQYVYLRSFTHFSWNALISGRVNVCACSNNSFRLSVDCLNPEHTYKTKVRLIL
ncbi:MAG: hypothetical protein BACC_04499 [Bacteroides sp.]